MTQTSDSSNVQMPCYVHGVIEPAEGAWLVCFECGHVYRTARALRRAYRREFWKVSRGDRFGWLTLRERVWRVLTIRVGEIFFCQHCLHDFAWMPPKRRWSRRAGDAA